MAKGVIAKEFIKEKLLETFEGSFVYNNGKEVRIPYEENGELVQIKVALTAAKEAVSADGEVLKAVAATAQEEAPIQSFPTPKVQIGRAHV